MHTRCVCVGGETTPLTYATRMTLKTLTLAWEAHTVSPGFCEISTNLQKQCSSSCQGVRGREEREGVLNRLFPLRVMKVFGNQIIVLVTEHCE